MLSNAALAFIIGAASTQLVSFMTGLFVYGSLSAFIPDFIEAHKDPEYVALNLFLTILSSLLVFVVLVERS